MKIAVTSASGNLGAAIIKQLLYYQDHNDVIAIARTPEKIKFPRCFLKKDSLDFSFSGIKTAVLYYLRDHPDRNATLADITASFQEAIVDTLTAKTILAAKMKRVDKIVVGGGVAHAPVVGLEEAGEVGVVALLERGHQLSLEARGPIRGRRPAPLRDLSDGEAQVVREVAAAHDQHPLLSQRREAARCASSRRRPSRGA